MSEKMKYHAMREGGRVKSAGTPVDFVFKQGDMFNANPSPSSAAAITKTFSTLRENPPTFLRDRFFPLGRGQIKAMTKRSPALFRPVLKTDQGAGKFLSFTLDKGIGAVPKVRVGREQGYVIIESHFEDQLQKAGFPRNVMLEVDAMRQHFTDRDLHETFLAYERAQSESEKAGLVFKREDAGVGRNAFMFIHPAMGESPIILPEYISKKAEYEVNQAMGELIQKAEEKKKEFAKKHGLSIRETDDFEFPHYFQADIQVLPDARVIVAELQIPDVGLFLAGLPSDGNDAFASIQKVVLPLKDKVINGFEQTIKDVFEKKGQMAIYLVTRPEVVEHGEDVLERKELQEIKNELAKRGYCAEILSASVVGELDSSSLLFLFNLDANSGSFMTVANAYLSDSERKLTMVPDPFLRMAEREITGYQKVKLSKAQIDNLAALVKEVELPEKPEKVYAQVMAIDYFLRQLGIKDDVLHFYHSVFPTLIPAYRYDVRGLHIASQMLAGYGIQNVEIRSVPISPENGIISDIDGGTLYATFRFMFSRR